MAVNKINFKTSIRLCVCIQNKWGLRAELQEENHLTFKLTPYTLTSVSIFSALYISFSTDKENLLYNQSFFGWWSFPLFSWSQQMIQPHCCKENLDAGHSQGLKVNYLLVTSIENLVSNNHYSVVLAISWLHIPTLRKGEYDKANQRLMRKKEWQVFS